MSFMAMLISPCWVSLAPFAYPVGPMFSWSRFAVGAAASFVVVFLFPRRGFFGKELVMELLVAVMKLLFAALRNGVGKARRIRCDVGMAFVGGSDCEAPNTFIWDGGIHGASKWIRPRIC